MTTRNDDHYPSPDPYDGCYGVQSDEYGQKPYHGPENPVSSPPDYNIAILEPQIEASALDEQGKVPTSGLLYGQAYYVSFIEPRETSNLSNDGTPNIDETISYKSDNMYETSYPEDPDSMGFSDTSIRRGFIRKVYLILSVQLLITAGIISIFVFCKPVAAFARATIWFWGFTAIFVVVLMFVIICCDEIRRTAPTNYILLGLFTVGESLMLGLISSRYRSDIVLMAMGMTAVMCLGLTLFSFQTKIDFTLCWGFIFISFLLLIVFGIMASIMHVYGEQKQIFSLLYASGGAIIFSIYLICDTQTMMAGHHKYSLSPEEYIFAALNLYVDIVYIFIWLLRILRYFDF